MTVYDASKVMPDDVVENITDEECESLQNNTGADASAGKNNCEYFNEELIPLLKQELDVIKNGSDITVFANDDSKCADDGLPTHASMWSRILRFAQALTCVLCSYDPFLANLLKSGKYPQVLMGAEGSEYPVWTTPDDKPKDGSQIPVTSGGVWQAIKDAILSVWHIWEEHPVFDYYFDTYTELEALDTADLENGTTALVAKGDGEKINVIYTYNKEAATWVETEVAGIDLANFTVAHFNKGYYAGKELYYMKDGENPVWSLMDASLKEFEDRLTNLEKRVKLSVHFAADNSEGNNGTAITHYLTVAPNLPEANALEPPEDNSSLIILIAGPSS